MSIGNITAIGFGVRKSWRQYWTTLISATVDGDSPKDLILTFLKSNFTTVVSDFLVAGNTVNSLSRSVDGKTITLICDKDVFAGTVAFVKVSGSSANITVELKRNIDSVLASGYYAISEVGAGGFIGHVSTKRSFFNRNNLTKIRQNGNVTAIKLFLTNTNLVEECFFDVWRKDGTTYDRVAHSDILALISNGTITITLPSPVAVIEGDFIGISGRQSSTGTVLGNVALTNGEYYVDSNPYPGPTDYNWAGATSFNYYTPIQTYMQTPLIVGIGDSLMAGHTSNYSNIENSAVVYLPGHIMSKMYALDSKYIFQNMGIGAQNSTTIAARFAADVVALKPKIVIINGFVAGLINSENQATMLANLTTMLDLCVANGIVPIVGKITPWTNGTNEQMQTRDTIMIALQALVATYVGAVWVDHDATIGQFRVGGDSGNLWDIKTDFDNDGVHLLPDGYAQMAANYNTAILAAGYSLG